MDIYRRKNWYWYVKGIFDGISNGLIDAADPRLDKGFEGLAQTYREIPYADFVIDGMKKKIIIKGDHRFNTARILLSNATSFDMHTRNNYIQRIREYVAVPADNGKHFQEYIQQKKWDAYAALFRDEVTRGRIKKGDPRFNTGLELMAQAQDW